VDEDITTANLGLALRFTASPNNLDLPRPLPAYDRTIGVAITAESDKMSLAALLKTAESPWHEESSLFIGLNT
jgi:hypothetical protein